MQASLSDPGQEQHESIAFTADKVEDEPETPTNHETNFFRFLKKDFEDLSLGPIKRPKHKKPAKPDNMAQVSSDQADADPLDDPAPENQEAAAAAWRAARAQKSCLHSGKPGSGKGGKAGADDDPTGSKWTQLETTWRVSTLPFRFVPTAVPACSTPLPPLLRAASSRSTPPFLGLTACAWG